MKLYTCYSPSHATLHHNYFLPSLIDGEYDLCVSVLPQICPSGEFESDGWSNFTASKIKIYVQAVKDNWGECFVWSDVDVQFFGQTQDVLVNELGNHDIAGQAERTPEDLDEMCTGLFICRSNQKMLDIFESMLNNYRGERDDQTAFNHRRSMVSYKLLSDRFWCKNLSQEPPLDILSHHANWIRGVQNKIDALEEMKKRFWFLRDGV